MYYQAEILQALLIREGPSYHIDSETVEEKLEKLVQKAGSLQVWAVVRFCSSLLHKVVDSLAPSVTAILVRGKQLTISVWGHEEEVIDKPVSPFDIKRIIYDRCYAVDPIQAVLQQELIINIGSYITTNPEYFQGILKIRTGWIIEAMRLEAGYIRNPGERVSINSFSPSRIKKLLLQCLVKQTDGDDRPIGFTRQMEGALNRVPIDFYDRVWNILNRTPAGVKSTGYYLPQQPTLSDMTLYELNFALLVEQMLSKITDVAYRQMVVESFMIVDALLSRNPEISFKVPIDMDRILHDAYYMYNVEVRGVNERPQPFHIEPFYDVSMNGKQSTTWYIVRSVMSQLQESEFKGLSDSQCSIM
jgi:phosphorylase kinase alpha/beta subunit